MEPTEQAKAAQPPAAEIHAELENGTRPEYGLDDSSFMLPTSIDRAGLSRMINDLLGLEEPVAFDILFRDEPLRTTLAEKLEQHQVESETTIKLVYVLAVTEPEETEVDTLNDWISGVAFTSHLGNPYRRDPKCAAHFATSCFDGHVAVYAADRLQKLAEFTTENKSATAVALHSSSDIGSHIEIVCGHINGLLEVYCLDAAVHKPTRNLVATSHSDTDTIASIALDAKGTLLAAAGSGKHIFVYDNVAIMHNYLNADETGSERSKRSLGGDTVEPLSTLSKHTKTVTVRAKVRGANGTRAALGVPGWPNRRVGRQEGDTTGNVPVREGNHLPRRQRRLLGNLHRPRGRHARRLATQRQGRGETAKHPRRRDQLQPDSQRRHRHVRPRGHRREGTPGESKPPLGCGTRRDRRVAGQTVRQDSAANGTAERTANNPYPPVYRREPRPSDSGRGWMILPHAAGPSGDCADHSRRSPELRNRGKGAKMSSNTSDSTRSKDDMELNDVESDDDLKLALKLSLEEYKSKAAAEARFSTQLSGFFGNMDDARPEEVLKHPDDRVSMSFILGEMHQFHRIIKNEVESAAEQIKTNADNADVRGEPRASVAVSRNRLADLVETLFGSEEHRLATSENIRAWCKQGFRFEDDPAAFWGLKQQYPGPCGVLASIQAYILQCLLFHNGMYGSMELLQQSEPEEAVLLQLREVYFNFIRLDHPDFPEGRRRFTRRIAFRVAAHSRVARGALRRPLQRHAHLPLHGHPLRAAAATGNPGRRRPNAPQNLASAAHAIIYNTNYVYVEFDNIADVASHLLKNLHLLMCEMGVMSFTLSVLATRGVEAVRSDMDDPTHPLVGNYGHSEQELVNLLLQGRAVSNVFDGEEVIQDGDPSLSYKLKGITAQGSVGFLTEREATRHCKVGSFYKNPRFPVWVIGSFSHYSVLFSINADSCRRTEREIQADAALKVWGCLDPDDNKFISKSLLSALLDMLAVPTLYQDACAHILTDSTIVLQASFLEWYLDRIGAAAGDARAGKLTLFHYNGQDALMPLCKVAVERVAPDVLQGLRATMGTDVSYGVDSAILGYAQGSSAEVAKAVWTRWPNTRVCAQPMLKMKPAAVLGESVPAPAL
ncbi:microtubule-associated protein [Babesia caballi]|uniref:Microtubule-associated protein n=1 Tax=Babesia caballi TaxID=5871 RepID=A0AAV4LNH2_BABCB|nr:microtubule-associated protein [Babesia caballi]